MLDASASKDPDGDPLKKAHWVIVDSAGLTVADLTVTDLRSAALVPSSPGVFTAKLTVTDSRGGTSRNVSVSLTVSAPTPIPVPTPQPAPTPLPIPGPTPAAPGRALLGGWRLAQEFARGSIAIDFATMRCWMTGHAQSNTVLEFELPVMGRGGVVDEWPALNPVRVIQGWWPSDAYGNGLCFWRGKVWAAPRVFYDLAPPATTTLYAEDGETVTIPLPRQVFSGFVKRGPGLDPFLGCGGYESGQGSSSGPSLATMDGTVLLQYGWPADPGPNLEHWNERAPREPNYVVGSDTWVGWQPRTINGVMQGRWASDTIQGGGLVLPEGITYWSLMGLGLLDYALQAETFGREVATYAYRYDQQTYALIGWERQPQFDGKQIGGQEIDAQGRAYLAVRNAWRSGLYYADVAIQVFG